MVLAQVLREQLDEARLGPLIPVLEDLGVELVEDFDLVQGADLQKPGITEIQRRRFFTWKAKLSPLPIASTPLATLPAIPFFPSSPTDGSTEFLDSWTSVGSINGSEHQAVNTELLQVQSFFINTPTVGELSEAVRIPPVIHVPRVRVRPFKPVEEVGVETFRRREIHGSMGPEDGWAWLRAEFPTLSSGGLEEAVDFVQDGLAYCDRRYHIVSVSKGSYSHGAVAWFASPPNGGSAHVLEESLRWGSRFRLEKPSLKRPYPQFLLRARVKQLLSSMMVVIDSSVLDFQICDNVHDEHGVIRDDGAGEADPDILEALAAKGLENVQEEGLCRHVPLSPQIRSGGLKGMLLGVERLRGTRRVEVTRTSLKFGGFGSELGVVTFSTIRPSALNLDTILQLEARGIDRAVFVDAQRHWLKKIGGALTRRRAFRLLREDASTEEAIGLNDGSSRRMPFTSSFTRMLFAGFDPEQHPLLSAIVAQQRKSLERAATSLRIPEVWSVRGHPEPKPPDGREPELRGHEVFCTVPACDGEAGSWRVLTGKVVINFSTDRDPAALRVATAVDNPVLRERCPCGLLFFSVTGPCLQEGLQWDFDGDYYQVISYSKLVELESLSPLKPVLALEPPEVGEEEMLPSLSALQADFLKTFPQVDHMGLHYYQWQLASGAGPQAAASEKARRHAAHYAASLDVEKGGLRHCAPPKRGFQPKWDFMKRSGADARASPTAAGELFRMATQALQDFDRVCSSPRGADQHLGAAWSHIAGRLGQTGVQALLRLASDVRGQVIERIKSEIRCREHRNVEENFDSQSLAGESDRLFEEWMQSTRSDAEAKAAVLSASLTDLALAAWHLKYIQQGVANRKDDPDKSFPWVIFCDELCAVKEQAQPCCQAATERYRRLLGAVRRAVKAAVADSHSEDALRYLKDALHRFQNLTVSCNACKVALRRQHTSLRLEDLAAHLDAGTINASGNEVLQQVFHAFRALADGEVRIIPCSELFYAKARIGRHFQHCKQTGEKLELLVDRLISQECRLELSAVRYHDRLYVVEGNRRLWCLKEAEKRLRKDLSIPVRISDMYLGSVRQQAQRCPALQTFWEKFTTQNGGTSVSFEGM